MRQSLIFSRNLIFIIKGNETHRRILSREMMCLHESIQQWGENATEAGHALDMLRNLLSS